MGISLEQLGDDLMADAARRVRERLPDLKKSKTFARRGLIPPTETFERISRYVEATSRAILPERASARADITTGQEALIGTSDLLSIEFLEAGLLAARAVARIEIQGTGLFGTGFLVGNGLLLTNHHVLPAPTLAGATVVTFGHEEQKFGAPSIPADFTLDPPRFWLTDSEHDFTLVALSAQSDLGVSLDSFGWHPLHEEGKILEGHPVAIVQHPQGRPKTIALHNSYFLIVDNASLEDRFCWYSGDTERGSSGSPVFNRDWQVVALHHKAVPRTNARNEILDKFGKTMSEARYKANPDMVDYVANEGVRASRLRRSIVSAALTDPAQAAQRDGLIALWDSPKGRSLRARFPAP